MVDLVELKQDLRVMSLEDVCIKYECSLKDILTEIQNERKTSFQSTPFSHIYKIGERFIIKKTINRKTVTFGSYKRLKEAYLVREKLMKNGWKKKNLLLYKQQAERECDEIRGLKYIQITQNATFTIRKLSQSTPVFYGVYDSLDDAKKIRNELIKVNFDKEELPRIQEELGITPNHQGRKKWK